MILVAIILLAQPIVASLILDRIYGNSFRREMRSKRSFVSLAALLAVEQEISHNKELCKEDEDSEYYILDYVRSYLVPKQRELSALWKRKIQEFS